MRSFKENDIKVILNTSIIIQGQTKIESISNKTVPLPPSIDNIANSTGDPNEQAFGVQNFLAMNTKGSDSRQTNASCWAGTQWSHRERLPNQSKREVKRRKLSYQIRSHHI